MLIEKKFSELVKQTRIAEGVTQEVFGKERGVSRVTVANWEGGKVTDIRTMERVAHSGDKGLSLVLATCSLIVGFKVEASQEDSDNIP